MAKITLFKEENYGGYSYALIDDVADFKTIDLNDSVSSAIVESGTWQIYSDKNYGNPSVTLSPVGGTNGDGNYNSAAEMGGRNDYFSSIRIVNDIESDSDTESK